MDITYHTSSWNLPLDIVRARVKLLFHTDIVSDEPVPFKDTPSQALLTMISTLIVDPGSARYDGSIELFKEITSPRTFYLYDMSNVLWKVKDVDRLKYFIRTGELDLEDLIGDTADVLEL
jgi:hypothetical protein